jgi:hypothetical protein
MESDLFLKDMDIWDEECLEEESKDPFWHSTFRSCPEGCPKEKCGQCQIELGDALARIYS